MDEADRRHPEALPAVQKSLLDEIRRGATDGTAEGENMKNEKLERAQAEAGAQLEILTALNPLDQDGIERVLKAVGHILEADRLVPGVLAAFRIPGKSHPKSS